jgi:hypothetical protein
MLRRKPKRNWRRNQTQNPSWPCRQTVPETGTTSHRLSSDVDLLGVVDGGSIKEEVSSRGTSFYRYPIETLRSKSENGDLFALHLKLEGKALHDTAEIFSNACERFRYRESYEQEIREGSGVIWYLVDRPQLLQSRAMRKRLVWGLRTIVIAKSAQQQQPVFSSADIAQFAEMPELKLLIDKRFAVPAQSLRDVSSKVASKFGITRSKLLWPSKPKDQQDLLMSLGGVAKATAEGLQRGRKRNSTDKVESSSFYI